MSDKREHEAVARIGSDNISRGESPGVGEDLSDDFGLFDAGDERRRPR
jgi:hypothetical protein